MRQSTSVITQTFLASAVDEKLEKIGEIFEQALRPNLEREPGCLSVSLHVSLAHDDGIHREGMIITTWTSLDALEAAMSKDGVNEALFELLLHVEGTPQMSTYRLYQSGEADNDPLNGPLASTSTVSDKSGNEELDSIWRTVQKGLAQANDADLKDHPYVRWYFLNSDRGPDYLRIASDASPDIVETFVNDYRNNAKGGLDDTSPGVIDPYSKTAQHLYYLMRLRMLIPGLETMNTIEIGGGLGNMARMAIQLNVCSRYDIVDIDEVTQLQVSYLDSVLSSEERRRAEVKSIQNESERSFLVSKFYNLCVSTFAITETPPTMMNWYLDFILRQTDYVYIVGQERWRAVDVVSPIRDRLTESFSVSESSLPFGSSNVARGFEIFGQRRDC